MTKMHVQYIVFDSIMLVYLHTVGCYCILHGKLMQTMVFMPSKGQFLDFEGTWNFLGCHLTLIYLFIAVVTIPKKISDFALLFQYVRKPFELKKITFNAQILEKLMWAIHWHQNKPPNLTPTAYSTFWVENMKKFWKVG